MFIPQELHPDAGTPLLHPEWIMAWKGIELDAQTPGRKAGYALFESFEKFEFCDSIVLLWSARNTTGCPLVSPIMLTSCVVRNN